MKYNLIYIDFPMEFEDANTGGSLRSGARYIYGAKNKYRAGTMKLQEVKELLFEINKVAAKNCIIAMWGFVPLADQCMELVECFKQFGFKYVTKFFWIKDRKKLGMGRNFRNDVEELILLDRGSKIMAITNDVEELIFIKRGSVEPFGLHIRNYFVLPPTEHSRKPDEFRWLVELVGWISFGRSANFLELFARQRSPGWEVLGHDIDGKDIRVSLKKLQAIA
jgi:N6-adenosine-specific RNA methylase IME4